MSFRTRLILGVSLIQALIFGVGALYNYKTQVLRERLLFADNVEKMIKRNARVCSQAELRICRELLDRARQDALIMYARLSVKGKVLVQTGTMPDKAAPGGEQLRAHQEASRLYATFEEVPLDDGNVGELEVGVSFAGLDSNLRKGLQDQLTIVLLQIVGGVLFVALMSHFLSRRLHDIKIACGKIMQGDFAVRVRLPKRAQDEISQMGQTINTMAEELQRLMTERDAQRREMTQSSKMSALGEMAGGVAHEVNNPLAVILATSDLMIKRAQMDDLPKEKMNEYLKRIASTAERIAKIVRGLRAFSRSSGADPMERVTMSTIVNDTLDLCAQRIRNAGVEMHIDTPADLTVRARPFQIAQILINLLNNSFDAIAENPEKWIRLETRQAGDSVEISVTDSGLGIAPDVASKLMQPFFTTKELGKGTGLGLSISKGIAEEHGGSLVYDPGSVHTRFILRLPLAASGEQRAA